MGSSRQEEWSGLPYPPSGDLPNPGIKPRSPALQEDSLPSEPPGKPKNTGVGSLSLPQGMLPIQESKWGLLHFWRILYQLSYQRSHRATGGFYLIKLKPFILHRNGVGRRLKTTHLGREVLPALLVPHVEDKLIATVCPGVI